MQPVRMKTPKRSRRGLKLIIAVVALLTVALMLFLLLRPYVPVGQIDDDKETNLSMLDHDEEKIERITVHPSRSESYVLLRTSDGIVLEGQTEYPLRDEVIKVLFYYAGHLTADELASDAKTARLADYGLEPGVCSVDVVLADGEQYTITLGGTVPMDEVRYYACISGNSNIYTVTYDVMDALNVQFSMLHPVAKLSIDASLIDRITLTDDSFTFMAEKTDSGWVITEPVRYPASQDAMDTLLLSLEKLRFAAWVGENSSDNREKYGLELSSGRALSIDFAASVLTVPDEEGKNQVFNIPESSIRIVQGNPYSDTADYYLYNNDIMTGTVLTFGFLRDFEWMKYVSKNPFVFELNNLSSLRILAEESTVTYEISYVERIQPNNEFETDEYGNILYDIRVKKNGKAIDAYAFSEYYERLRRLTGVVNLEEPLITDMMDNVHAVITVVSDNGSEQMTIGILPGADKMDIVSVDGVALFSVPTAWMDTVLDIP